MEEFLKDAMKAWQDEIKHVDAEINNKVNALQQEIDILRAKLYVLNAVAKKLGGTDAADFHQEYGSHGIMAEIEEKENYLEELKELHRMRSTSTRLIIETIKES